MCNEHLRKLFNIPVSIALARSKASKEKKKEKIIHFNILLKIR